MKEVSGRGIIISHGPAGQRRIVATRTDGSRVVTNRTGTNGYVQRTYTYRNTTYASRTYVYNNRTYVGYYGGYRYGRGYYYGYSPAFYYRPAYYGWAYNPWASPAYYSWGWGGSPWYGYYGPYFSPAPYYPSASLWLTDYLVSTSLAEAYNERAQAANAQAIPPETGDPAPLTPAVKQQIAAEVQYQLALESSGQQTVANNGSPDPASSGLTRIFTDRKPHIFVVANSLNVSDDTGQECAITEGDVLQLNAAPPEGSETANLQVLASKGAECGKGAVVTVALADLQEMLNHMQASIDQGLADLRQKAGKNGLPALPPAAAAEPTPSPVAQGAPPSDPNVAAELKEQATQADTVDRQAVIEANGPNAADQAPPPPSAEPQDGPSIGQTQEQVIAELGTGYTRLSAGPKTIFLYRDLKLKITFTNGKVSAVE